MVLARAIHILLFFFIFSMLFDLNASYDYI